MASVDPQQTVISFSGSIGDSIIPGKLVGNGLAQGWSSPGDRILVEIRCDCPDRSFLDFCGSLKIGKPLGEVHPLMFQADPGHVPNDRFREFQRPLRRIIFHFLVPLERPKFLMIWGYRVHTYSQNYTGFLKKIQDTLKFPLTVFPSRLCNKNPAKMDTLGGIFHKQFIFEKCRPDSING